MKVKSALKQSKAHAKFFAAVLIVLMGVLAVFPERMTLVLVGVAVLALSAEVINIVHITRQSRKNPAYLDETIR